MIDYDYYTSEIADALDQNGETKGYHKAKILIGTIKSIFEKSSKDETYDMLEKTVNLINIHKLRPIELINIFVEKMDNTLRSSKMKPMIDIELNRIKDLCKEEIKAGSFFNGNIQACEFAYWLQHSGYEPGELPIGKFSSIDALSMMKRWAEEN
jgi:retron-type reverse transcriptase